MSPIDPNATVAEIATVRPLSIPVLQRYGIRFGRSGEVSLVALCASAGVEPSLLLAEIAEAEENASRPGVRWDLRTPGELVKHIVGAYHVPMTAELGRIEDLSIDLYHHESDRDGARHRALVQTVVDGFIFLKDELEQHMEKEENVVFKMIVSGSHYVPRLPVKVLMDEHALGDTLIDGIRQMTEGLTLFREASPLWDKFYRGIEGLERDLEVHTHLENNILFPRAILGRLPWHRLETCGEVH